MPHTGSDEGEPDRHSWRWLDLSKGKAMANQAQNQCHRTLSTTMWNAVAIHRRWNMLVQLSAFVEQDAQKQTYQAQNQLSMRQGWYVQQRWHLCGVTHFSQPRPFTHYIESSSIIVYFLAESVDSRLLPGPGLAMDAAQMSHVHMLEQQLARIMEERDAAEIAHAHERNRSVHQQNTCALSSICGLGRQLFDNKLG